MVLKQSNVRVTLLWIAVFSIPHGALHCADKTLQAYNKTLPALSHELINATPLNATSLLSTAPYADLGQMATSALPDVASAYAAPFAVSTLAAHMKNPYILLAVSEGVAVAYLLLGQQTVPAQAAQAYIESFNKNIAMSALTGAVSAVAGTAAKGIITSSYAAYAKPLIMGGALVGAATTYFSPDFSDEQKALSYAGLVAACTPVVQMMCASVLEGLKPVEPKTKIQKIRDAQKNKDSSKAAGQTKERATHIAVALIALGGVVTTVQAYQEGTLSADTHLLAGLTLSSAVALARETVLYEYGYRAAQKSIAVGSQIVTHVVTEPIKQYGQRLVEGVFNAFGWSRQ